MIKNDDDVVRRPKEVAKLAHFWEKSNHTFGFGGCQVYFRLFRVSKMTAKLTYLHRI